MPQPSNHEQLLLELVNDARLDPLGNAARYISSYSPRPISGDSEIQATMDFFRVSGSALEAAFMALSMTFPLAWNDNLARAAHDHSAAMISAGRQTHQAPGEQRLIHRVNNASQLRWSDAAENVYAYSKSVDYVHAGFMIDWGSGGRHGMQPQAGHRNAIMDPTLREIGIDITPVGRSARDLGPLVVTQNFGMRRKWFVLGVAYGDRDGNRFYTPGEGRGDLSIQRVGGGSTSTGASGGYSLETDVGPQTFMLSGGGLRGRVSVTANVSTNLKLDVVSGRKLLSSGSVEVSGPIAELRGLGRAGLSLSTGAGDELLAGTPGNDTLNGNEGEDVAEFTGNRSRYRIRGGFGDFIVSGPDGVDRLLNIETLRFADGDYGWRPSGVLAMNTRSR